MDASIRAGVAVYNAGEYHATHDAWEDEWLALEAGTDDELLLHGLIQFTAAIYHARRRNWSGATGLCASAGEYLLDLPSPYRRVDVAAVRAALRALEADPERVERGPPPALTYGGRVLDATDLDVSALAIAAAVVADEYEAYDEAVVADAIEYAEEEASGPKSRFIGLLSDFVGDPDRRSLVYDRLAAHVERRRQRERDVSGLFD